MERLHSVVRFTKHCLGRRWSWLCLKRDSEHRRSRRLLSFPNLWCWGAQLLSWPQQVLFAVAAGKSWFRQGSLSLFCSVSLLLFHLQMFSSTVLLLLKYFLASAWGSLPIGSLCLERIGWLSRLDSVPHCWVAFWMKPLLRAYSWDPLPDLPFPPKHFSLSITLCNLRNVCIICCISPSSIFC